MLSGFRGYFPCDKTHFSAKTGRLCWPYRRLGSLCVGRGYATTKDGEVKFCFRTGSFLALANQRQAIVERKGDPSIVNSFGEELADETYHAPHGGKAASEIEAHIPLLQRCWRS